MSKDQQKDEAIQGSLQKDFFLFQFFTVTLFFGWYMKYEMPEGEQISYQSQNSPMAAKVVGAGKAGIERLKIFAEKARGKITGQESTTAGSTPSRSPGPGQSSE